MGVELGRRWQPGNWQLPLSRSSSRSAVAGWIGPWPSTFQGARLLDVPAGTSSGDTPRVPAGTSMGGEPEGAQDLRAARVTKSAASGQHRVGR